MKMTSIDAARFYENMEGRGGTNNLENAFECGESHAPACQSCIGHGRLRTRRVVDSPASLSGGDGMVRIGKTYGEVVALTQGVGEAKVGLIRTRPPIRRPLEPSDEKQSGHF